MGINFSPLVFQTVSPSNFHEIIHQYVQFNRKIIEPTLTAILKSNQPSRPAQRNPWPLTKRRRGNPKGRPGGAGFEFQFALSDRSSSQQRQQQRQLCILEPGKFRALGAKRGRKKSSRDEKKAPRVARIFTCPVCWALLGSPLSLPQLHFTVWPLMSVLWTATMACVADSFVENLRRRKAKNRRY